MDHGERGENFLPWSSETRNTFDVIANCIQAYNELKLTVPALLDTDETGDSDDLVMLHYMLKSGLIFQMRFLFNPLMLTLLVEFPRLGWRRGRHGQRRHKNSTWRRYRVVRSKEESGMPVSLQKPSFDDEIPSIFTIVSCV